MRKNITVLFLFITGAFFSYCFFPMLTYDSPELLGPGQIFLTDRNGSIITDKMHANGYSKYIDTDEESVFAQALLEIEDKNYYLHKGVNIPAKLRAFRDNIAGKRISGGSTITEQYIKNKYFKESSRSYLQKIREAVIAVYVNATMEKKDILKSYYHNAYFGNQLYGIGAALEVYFQKEKGDDLTQEEIVLLLSLLHNPGIESLEEEYFQGYFHQVKSRLGYDFERTYFGTLPKKKNIDRFPFVTQIYMQNPVDTTMSIDAELQGFSKEMLQDTLNELSDKNVTNGAVFALQPKTGEILIYQGSKDFYATDIDGQVDVITSLRQPGSTMKPFLFLLALQSGAGADDLILDIESQYNSFQNDGVYVSENYSLKEYGLVRLKKALGNSLNNASVRLAQELGLVRVYEFYKQYGFRLPYSPEHYGYSLVLGNPSITLKELVYSYSQLLDLEKPEHFLLYDILSDSDNRDISFGVNSLLNTSIAQAVKTGTTSDFRDNLVVSYHPDFVLGVWVGNNDNSSMHGVTGITGAGYIWHHIIEKAIELGYITERYIDVPDGIEKTSYCLDLPCFRKENIYASPKKEYFSRLVEGLYRKEDLFGELSEYEISRLEELSIDLE